MSAQTPSDTSAQDHTPMQYPAEHILSANTVKTARSPYARSCLSQQGTSIQPVRIGRQIEERAVEILKARGWREVARNYCIRGGEIDLIMRHEDTLVFVEVRYRKNSRHGSAAESITLTKRKRIIRAAQHFMANQVGSDIAARFDVIAFYGLTQQNMACEWIPNAFDCF